MEIISLPFRVEFSSPAAHRLGGLQREGLPWWAKRALGSWPHLSNGNGYATVQT